MATHPSAPAMVTHTAMAMMSMSLCFFWWFNRGFSICPKHLRNAGTVRGGKGYRRRELDAIALG